MTIIGTRGSKLALTQVEIFLERTGIKAEVRIIRTTGDKSRKSLSNLEIGVFTRELDNALLSGEIDIAVHSLKDIPTEIPEELEISGICERGDARDCLVTTNGLRLDEIPSGSVIGTDSDRRKAEILNLRRDLRIKEIRGNIPTRLSKLRKGYDGIIVSKCALDRLGLRDRISQIFEIDQMVPAAGQGAIAIVKRKRDRIDIPDEFRKNYTPCELERIFIEGLGGCKIPVGAYCNFSGKFYHMVGLIYKNNKRIFNEFHGNFDEVVKEIGGWKRRYIYG